jgi:hypothetical protein
MKQFLQFATNMFVEANVCDKLFKIYSKKKKIINVCTNYEPKMVIIGFNIK